MASNKYTKANIGKYFSFTLSKELTFPGNIEGYYIIEDEHHNKFTLPKIFYTNYNFIVGQSIEVRLDHINCDDRLFFEPKNPFYLENQVYTFEFIEFKTITNHLGFSETIALVVDSMGLKQKVHYALHSDVKNGEIKARVSLIKKGKLFLLPIHMNSSIFQANKPGYFSYVKTTNTERFGEVYVVSDEFDNLHALPTKYYNHYKIEEHKGFNGLVHKVSSKGFLYIEPLHPIYDIGKTYHFKVFNLLQKNNKSYFFIEDCFGNIIQVNNNKVYANKEFLKCTVTSLKKGCPILQMCE